MKIKTLLIIAILLGIIGCESMEDNYLHYQEDEKVYSPKVKNLVAVSGLREATLSWDNPEGELAKMIYVDLGDSQITIEEMVTTVTLTELEIRGYDISVFTIDAFGNYSVPETVQIFPNGEE